jgi:hypothetical protein
MSADQLIAAITAIVTDVNALVKLGLIIGLAVYVLIALIIYRQMSVLGSSGSVIEGNDGIVAG